MIIIMMIIILYMADIWFSLVLARRCCFSQEAIMSARSHLCKWQCSQSNWCHTLARTFSTCLVVPWFVLVFVWWYWQVCNRVSSSLLLILLLVIRLGDWEYLFVYVICSSVTCNLTLSNACHMGNGTFEGIVLQGSVKVWCHLVWWFLLYQAWVDRWQMLATLQDLPPTRSHLI